MSLHPLDSETSDTIRDIRLTIMDVSMQLHGIEEHTKARALSLAGDRLATLAQRLEDTAQTVLVAPSAK